MKRIEKVDVLRAVVPHALGEGSRPRQTGARASSRTSDEHVARPPQRDSQPGHRELAWHSGVSEQPKQLRNLVGTQLPRPAPQNRCASSETAPR